MKTDNIFKKIDLVFACFCLFLVFFSLVIYSNESVYQLDIWLHLRTGEWIFANNAIPHQDIYSFVYFGNKWLDHEWLFQVITYCFFAASGFPGLLLMQTIVSVIVFLIFLFIGYRTKEYLISLVPLLLCLYLFRIRFMRPEIFSLLFLAVYLLIIDRYLHSKWFPFVLIPVQILWVNMHGFFFIGPLLILLLVIGDFIKSKIKLPLDWNASHKLDDHTRKKLICLFLYLILACLVNPYFWEGALYPLKIFFSLSGESKVFFKDIVELRPPITIERGMFAKIAASNYLIHYIILVIISLLSFRLNKKNTDIFHIVIWVFFFILATISIRNVAFFGFIAYFIFSQNMRESFSLPPKTSLLPSEKVRYVLKWLLTIFIIMFLLTDVARFLNARFFIFDNYEFSRQFGGSTKFIFPEKAVDFILANKIKGNIYNEFNSGAYLIGRCSPGIKVFIDGRTEAYDVNFYKEYARIMDGDTALLEEKLKKYDLKVALLNSALSEVPAAVLNYFYNHADWKLVFFDEFGLVFLKDVKENKAIIDRFTIDLRNWQPPVADLKKIGFTAPDPYPYIRRAKTLYDLGLEQPVILESEQALKINPYARKAYEFLGAVYYKQKLYEKAFENNRLATILFPNSAKLRLNSGLILSALGYLDNAIDELEAAIEIEPKNADLYYKLALLFKQTGKNKETIKSLKQAIKLVPANADYLFELALAYSNEKNFLPAFDLYKRAIEIKSNAITMHYFFANALTEVGRYKEAEDEYKKALEIDNKYVEAYNNLGVLYAITNRLSEAKSFWKQGLRLDPKNSDIRKNLKEMKNFVAGKR